jgi:stage IV sporulation protein FB
VSGLQIFSIAGIPVRVSLWYGFLLLFWFQGPDLYGSTLWAIVVTVSILVHELGHALVARHYRLNPSILLHGLGGLCNHERAERDLHDVLIIAAGPLAGLALGVASWVFAQSAPELMASPEHPWIGIAVNNSIWVNIVWSIVNLLPLWPLDGGQLFRLAMLRVAKPKRAEQITHFTALGLLALAAALGFVYGGTLLLFLVLWIAWSNIVALRSGSVSGPIRMTNKHAAAVVEQALLAYEREDFAEAARLCHQVRSENNVPEKVMREAWRILGVSSARLGEHQDALTFLKHAPPTRDVVEARVECYYALGLDSQLDGLLASGEFAAIPEERRREILDVVRPGH